MQSTHRPKKCLCCKQWFQPDPRSHPRQRYCSEIRCQKERKATRQKRFLSEHPDHWSKPKYVKKTQDWRIKKRAAAKLNSSSNLHHSQ